MRTSLICLFAVVFPVHGMAHDIWVETNTPIIRQGDIVHIDLKLGNHGNDHRDFKLASKISLESCRITVTDPHETILNLKPLLVDTGFTTKEGYWTARLATREAGMHVVSSTVDNLRGKTRTIKSAKCYFLTCQKLDELPPGSTRFEVPLGHGLEIVPLSNPLTAMGPDQPIRVKVLLDSKPLADTRVAFVPRGTVLKDGFDPEYERTTDAAGIASFTPHEGNIILIVVHQAAPDQKGEGYDTTSYSATLTIAVPQICPQCSKEVTSK